MGDREFESRYKMLVRIYDELRYLRSLIWGIIIIGSASLGTLGFMIGRGL